MPDKTVCDLHMHSTMSDGTDSPRSLAKMCVENGINFAALTDHDTAAGIGDFAYPGLRTISGIEWNVEYYGEELHILGYGFDPSHPALVEAMLEMKHNRKYRATMMTKKLAAAGYDITIDDVKEKARGIVIGRPHIAMVLVDKGYANTIREAFDKFLVKGAPGYHTRIKIPSRRVIETTNLAGGLCVMAHPGVTNDPDLKALLARLTDEGLSGIEIFYPTHSDEEIALYEKLAAEFSLFATRGSDYHGYTREEIKIGCENRTSPLLEKGTQALLRLV